MEVSQFTWSPDTDNKRIYMTIDGLSIGCYDSYQKIVTAMGVSRKVEAGQDYKDVAFEICTEVTKLMFNVDFKNV